MSWGLFWEEGMKNKWFFFCMLKHMSLSGKNYCRAGNSFSQWNLPKLKSPLRKLCQSLVSQSEWPDGSLVDPFLGASRDPWSLTALAAKEAAHSAAWHWKMVPVEDLLISIFCCPTDDPCALAIHGSPGFLCHSCPHIPERSWRRWQISPLWTRVATAQLRGPSNPWRGSPAAPRPYKRPPHQRL